MGRSVMPWLTTAPSALWPCCLDYNRKTVSETGRGVMATEEGATEAALAAPDPETAGVAEEEEEPALKHEEEEEEEGPATTVSQE